MKPFFRDRIKYEYMKWQTLDLRYAENLVAFPEFYLIFSDWQSFNKVDKDAMDYLCNTRISIRLSNVLQLEEETACHLMRHKQFLQIGITRLENEIIARSLLNDRIHLVFTHLNYIDRRCYKYFENKIDYLKFDELNSLDNVLVHYLSKHVGTLVFENIKEFSEDQIKILQSHEGEIIINNVLK